VKKFNFLFVFVLLLSFFLITGSNAFAQEEVMTNDEVISLATAGLNSSVIVNKIRTSKSKFDMSTDALIKLKKAGINDEIVNAMLEAKSGKTMTVASTGSGVSAGNPNDPMSPHDFGIYLYEERNGERKMTQLVPNVSAQNRTGGGFTAAITPFGLGKMKTKANLPGTTASLQLKDPRPVFYFYLDTKSGGLNTSSGIPSTTNEFTMVRFNVRSDNREITISKQNAYGAKGGLSDEYVIPFTTETLGNGIFKVTPSADLKNGEYGFYLINSGGSNASAAVGAKFFDFGIRLTP
jgi:hypothetical protein